MMMGVMLFDNAGVATSLNNNKFDLGFVPMLAHEGVDKLSWPNVND